MHERLADASNGPRGEASDAPMRVVPATRLTGRRGWPLLPASASDRYFDYCLEPYVPRRPWQGKIRGENLLWHSLSVAGLEASLREPLRAVQRAVGPDLTVWGTKWDGRELFWELYFYDPRGEAPEARVTSLRETLAPWLALRPVVRESTPYMMVSFELSAEVTRTRCIDRLDLYLTGESHHAGRCYEVTYAQDTDGLGATPRIELRNTYRFFEAKPEADAMLALLRSSAFVDYTDPRTLPRVLIPELFACKKICVAKKRTCDGIYYSGIDVERLEWFLRRFGYPSALTAFVREHRAALDHLYFDVGIDYVQDPSSGAISYPKTSFYGTL
jgi:hypothetical protein